jgi:hypothetical protein
MPAHDWFFVWLPKTLTDPSRPRTVTRAMRPPTKRTSVGRLERNATAREPCELSDDEQPAVVAVGAVV